MSIRNRPNYGVFMIPLAVAGSLDIPVEATRITMAGAYNGATLAFIAGGGQVLSGGSPATALVNVQIGKSLGDPIPFAVGTTVKVDNKFDAVRLQWPAQAGTTAVIVVSDDADGNGVEISAPPTVSLGSMSIIQGGNTATVDTGGGLHVAPSANSANGTASKAPSVTTTAAAIDATTTAIKRVISAPLTNTSIIYLGGTGVSAANGFPLYPGDVIEMTGGVACYGLAAAGTQKLNIQLVTG